MKPLIKYTGGKYKEYLQIKEYFPSKINNYYEPFFGGGGVFFRLKEENKITGNSFLSDISDDLIDFYNTNGVCTFKMLGSNKSVTYQRTIATGVCTFKMLGSNKRCSFAKIGIYGVCTFKMLGSNKDGR